jgi:hypothetical protein
MRFVWIERMNALFETLTLLYASVDILFDSTSQWMPLLGPIKANTGAKEYALNWVYDLGFFLCVVVSGLS